MRLEEIMASSNRRRRVARPSASTARRPTTCWWSAAARRVRPAAIYAARKGIRTGIAAERFGGQLLDTVGIENFISVKETEGHKLAAGLEQHVGAYEVDVMNLQRAAALDSGRVDRGVELASGAVAQGASQ